MKDDVTRVRYVIEQDVPEWYRDKLEEAASHGKPVLLRGGGPITVLSVDEAGEGSHTTYYGPIRDKHTSDWQREAEEHPGERRYDVPEYSEGLWRAMMRMLRRRA